MVIRFLLWLLLSLPNQVKFNRELPRKSIERIIRLFLRRMLAILLCRLIRLIHRSRLRVLFYSIRLMTTRLVLRLLLIIVPSLWVARVVCVMELFRFRMTRKPISDIRSLLWTGKCSFPTPQVLKLVLLLLKVMLICSLNLMILTRSMHLPLRMVLPGPRLVKMMLLKVVRSSNMF